MASMKRAMPAPRRQPLSSMSISPIKLKGPPQLITKNLKLAKPIPRRIGKTVSKPKALLPTPGAKKQSASPAAAPAPAPATAPEAEPERYIASPSDGAPQEEQTEEQEQEEYQEEYQEQPQDSEEEYEEEYEDDEYQGEHETDETIATLDDGEYDAGEYYENEELSSGIYGEGLSLPMVASHVHDGHMHTAAITVSPHGCGTVVSCVPCPGADRDGLVSFSGDNPNWLSGPIDAAKREIILKAQSEAPKKEIGSIVRRARAGDQNAMGIIAMVRTRAQAGDATAKRSAALMHDYIRDNPATGDMGHELAFLESPKAKLDKLCAVLVLANGPPLGNSRIREFGAQFGEEKHKKVFLYGVIRFRLNGELVDLEKRLDEFSKSVLDVGRTIGEARAIQMVRLPNSSITKFHPLIGWELGE